jgi:hypothetical protein
VTPIGGVALGEHPPRIGIDREHSNTRKFLQLIFNCLRGLGTIDK